MKNTVKAAMLALALSVAGAMAAKAEQIKVGFSPEAYPPFYAQDASGNWGGWEVEIINAMCSEAKLECVLTPIPWDGLAISAAAALALFVVGCLYFRRVEDEFADKI